MKKKCLLRDLVQKAFCSFGNVVFSKVALNEISGTPEKRYQVYIMVYFDVSLSVVVMHTPVHFCVHVTLDFTVKSSEIALCGM
jgi:hypothetical protein